MFSLMRGVLVVSFLLCAAGCSLVVEPDIGSLGDPPVTCNPGQLVPCACLGGRTGEQRCTGGGKLAPCECAQAGAGG